MYRNNFQQLAKQIKPDGNSIKTVGFTASFGNGERRVLLQSDTKPVAISKIEKAGAKQNSADKEPEQNIEIQGTLKFADSTKKSNNEIRLIDESGVSHRIKVPTELMEDVVRPFWGDKVKIKGLQKRKSGIITLQNIEAVIN
jgi:hypothetical protein